MVLMRTVLNLFLSGADVEKGALALLLAGSKRDFVSFWLWWVHDKQPNSGQRLIVRHVLTCISPLDMPIYVSKLALGMK